jgi:hypothetical protein
MSFVNRDSSRLGQPLPKGVVRVYKRDSRQRNSSARIASTTRQNEQVRLRLGDAFDVTPTKQTDFRRREPTNKASYVFERLRNRAAQRQEQAMTVTVREPVPGEWTMLEESQPHAKVAAGTAQWQVNVPAGGTTTLKYRVLVRY